MIDEGTASPRSAPPVVGETVSLSVRYPFEGRLGEPFWCVYTPRLSALNGLADTPAEIPEDRMLLCSPTAIGPVPDRPPHVRTAENYAHCRTVVVGVLTLEDLFAMPVRAWSGGPVGFYRDVEQAACGEWHYIVSDTEGDISDWGIWREVDGVGHVLMQGYFDHHSEFVDAGHRLLTPDEHRYLGVGRRGR